VTSDWAPSNKVMSLTEAVSGSVRSGDTIFIGGFGHCIPFALARAIVRSDIRHLTVCKTGADIVLDLLVASGSVDEIVVGWFGNPGLGISHVISRALSVGQLRLSESTNFAVLLRLHAARLGVPFLPTRTIAPGNLRDRTRDVETVTCPFTGEELTAVPALVPDVALIHAQRADRDGNVQMWGVTGDTVIGAEASRRVICTVEEIVESTTIRTNPDRTILAGHRVNAIVAATRGAVPSYVEGHYPRDDAFYQQFQTHSKDASWVDEFVARIRRNEEDAAWSSA